MKEKDNACVLFMRIIDILFYIVWLCFIFALLALICLCWNFNFSFFFFCYILFPPFFFSVACYTLRHSICLYFSCFLLCLVLFIFKFFLFIFWVIGWFLRIFLFFFFHSLSQCTASFLFTVYINITVAILTKFDITVLLLTK